MNKLRFIMLLLLLPFLVAAQSNKTYTYDTVPGDPLKARIYTLNNGLKVYLSVYKDEPRFQSMIGVMAGSKNDPADHTGLAHYLEHMLFKGTDQYGTSDYAKEAPLLDTIFNLYDRYGQTKDSLKRAMIYHQIDSVSGVAAKYAVPNEFDKMMAAMGVSGTNAYTSVEQTVYINNVPSNQLERFIKVEAERFRKPVMRIFHTELEAVYEEKNRALDSDQRKVFEELYSGLFQQHQYGTQTTIGTIEHLKNPSLIEIKKFLDTYYVPNNMVIALSGDFDPDQAIRLIDQYFGKMERKPVPTFTVNKEPLIKSPIVKTVYGPDAESVTIGFRFDGASSQDADVLQMVDMILSNGQAGLLDLNLNNAQKVLGAGSYSDIMKDYSVHVLSGRAREGQSLEEVRDLLLGQIMEIKNGNFPDWLIDAIITNLRAEAEKQNESNQNRASTMLDAEVLGVSYATIVSKLDRLSKVNKTQVMDFVKKWYGDNYVIVYKRTGEDKSVIKVVKPTITPVATNADKQSVFVKQLMGETPPETAPVFIDFNKAVTTTKLSSGITLYSTQNTENNLFEMQYVVSMGNNHDRKIPIALQYLNYLGSERLNSAQLKEEFYKLGCDFNAGASEDELFIELSGIQQNFGAALGLLEEFLKSPKADKDALDNLIVDILKGRENAKLNKNTILSRMQSFAKYGAVSPATNILSETELKSLRPEELVTMIRNLTGYQHRVDYYGPAKPAELKASIEKYHKVPKKLQAVPAPKDFKELDTNEPKVFVVNYEMQQAEMVFLGKGLDYDSTRIPVIAIYNRYFGGGMQSPVFQTLRESKALAYAVSSRYNQPQDNKHAYYNYAYIGSQVDKLPEAMAGMTELLQEMPMNDNGLMIAKKSLEQQIRTDRITKSEILRTYHNNEKYGVKGDTRKMIFDALPSLSMKEVAAFQNTYVRPLKYTTIVLGKQGRLDLKSLEKYGPVTTLELKDIFGY
jgi:predicted Zn-dependent peptidase